MSRRAGAAADLPDIEAHRASPAAMLDAFVAGGHCRSGQLVVRVDGRQVLSHAAGEARPGVPMSVGTKARLDCAMKPVVAMGILALAARGLLSVDEPVSRYVPEFGCGGKETITAHHLLTHTAGHFMPRNAFPYISSPAVLKQRLFAGEIGDWTPGTVIRYDSWGGWWTLTEMIERVTTIPWTDFLTEHVLRPAGADALELVPVPGPDPSRLELAYWSLRFGGPVCELTRLNSPQALAWPNPAYGGYAPMEALAELYSVLSEPERCRDLLGFDPSPMTTTQQPAGLTEEPPDRFVTGSEEDDGADRSFRVENGMGYGMFLRLDRCNFYRAVSPASFGHHSNAGTWGMCDPRAGLVIALRMNGVPRELVGDGSAYRSTHGHPVVAAVYRAFR
ncbi:serine hydrolase domain-containing protein [Micromonospora sp. WMMD714]|uniref:serine hydrolase domain-containing protein n=1 Tax=Micromonospora sp. WMMD714 TaxID=3016097 RepID=UPI00249B8E82|nr:serine hydrolase domain-containing protein [Micromonospora sp. WMMD714]WFE64139.1 serine hydrolase [Micromonospora sp. WMMD714]